MRDVAWPPESPPLSLQAHESMSTDGANWTAWGAVPGTTAACDETQVQGTDVTLPLLASKGRQREEKEDHI